MRLLLEMFDSGESWKKKATWDKIVFTWISGSHWNYLGNTISIDLQWYNHMDHCDHKSFSTISREATGVGKLTWSSPIGKGLMVCARWKVFASTSLFARVWECQFAFNPVCHEDLLLFYRKASKKFERSIFFVVAFLWSFPCPVDNWIITFCVSFGP